MNTVDEISENGANLLDSINPGWADKVNLDELDINSFGYCILGQVYGTFLKSLDHVLPHMFFGQNIANFGFAVPYGMQERDLRAAWTKLIIARRG
jgi:hypothetical protein